MIKLRTTKIIMLMGKPTHFAIKNNVTACGLIGKHYSAHDARDCNCLNCMKTKAYKVYMGKA
jgi:hypothetical protein